MRPVVERHEAVQADFDAFGDLGSVCGPDEMDAGLGQLLVDDPEGENVGAGSPDRADQHRIVLAGHAAAKAMGP